MSKDLLPLFIFFAPMMALSMFTVSATQSGSFQRRTPSKQWVFSPPDAVPVFLVSLFLLIAAMCTAIDNRTVFQAIPTTFGWQYVKTHFTVQVMELGLGVAFLYWSVLFWWHKKCVLVLDADTHSYRTLSASTAIPSVRTGTWDDISGIAVKRVSAKGSTSYLVVLKWKQATLLYSTLGGFSQADKAHDYAQRLSNELHLPLVAPIY
jgi:hypothetical protein